MSEEESNGGEMSYSEYFHMRANDQGFEDPIRQSPIDTPEGWEAGGVEQTGGWVLCRRWRTEGWDEEPYERYLEAIYGEQDAVSIHLYVFDEDEGGEDDDGYYVFDREINTRFAGENTDERKAEIAKEMMEEMEVEEIDV